MRLEIRKRKTSPPYPTGPSPDPSPIGRGVECKEGNWPLPRPLPHREGSEMRDTPIG